MWTVKETQALLQLAQNEAMKSALIDRARRELCRHGFGAPQEAITVKVTIELELKIENGRPAQVLTVLRERLPDVMLVAEDLGVLAQVQSISRLEIA